MQIEIEKVIEILKKKIESKRNYAEYVGEKNEETYIEYMNEAFILEGTLKLLTDEKYFNEMANLWLEEE